MKTFLDLDPNVLQNDPRIIFSFVENRPQYPDEYYFLMKDGDFLIWASRGVLPAMNGKPAKWSGGTILEFPKIGLSWFIDTLEQKFFKMEAEGGLPKGEFTYTEKVMDEELTVARMFGVSGYAFRNYDRQDYAYKTMKRPQQANLSDEILFEKGLFGQLKFIAEKITKGEI